MHWLDVEAFPLLQKFPSPPPYQEVLLWDLEVSAADAVYRDINHFTAGSLVFCKDFWESHILADHPNKFEILDWLDGGGKG